MAKNLTIEVRVIDRAPQFLSIGRHIGYAETFIGPALDAGDDAYIIELLGVIVFWLWEYEELHMKHEGFFKKYDAARNNL